MRRVTDEAGKTLGVSLDPPRPEALAMLPGLEAPGSPLTIINEPDGRLTITDTKEVTR
jgi:hypothetical protein